MKKNVSSLSTLLLREQLRRVGWTIEKVQKKYGKANNKWLTEIRWASQKEADDFREWAIRTIMKKEGWGKAYTEHFFSTWDLNLGLGIGPVNK